MTRSQLISGSAAVTFSLMAVTCGDFANFDPRACPRERAYSKQQQAQIADDLKKSPQSVRGAFVDYGKLRDQARACRGERVPR